MFKKTLFIAAVAAIGISGAAFAGGGGEHMAPMPAATPMSSFNPGFYVGIQGGYADSAWDNMENTGLTVSGHTGIGGRVYVGYDFMKHFAVEAGYTRFANEAEITIGGIKAADITTQAFDIVGKMKVPLDNGFGLYAKAGLGYLMSDGLHDGTAAVRQFEDDDFNHLGLVYGLGASYDVTPNFMIDLSWTRFNGEPSAKVNNNGLLTDYQPNADLYAIGLSYKFDM